jgi:hypothetical protein
MRKFKINKLILYSMILIFIFYTNFFTNMFKIYSKNYDDRINSTYDFCLNESIGYLKYLKKNYKLDNNPKIVNYIHTPPVLWSIFDPKVSNQTSNQIILLNYPGEIIEINHNIKNHNIVEINNLSFLIDKIDKIKDIYIFLKKPLDKNLLKIDLLSEINLGKRDLIKSFNQSEIIEKNKIHFKINLNINDLYPKNNNIAFKIQNLKKNSISNIKIVGENRFKLNNFNIINQYQNCFLINND